MLKTAFCWLWMLAFPFMVFAQKKDAPVVESFELDGVLGNYMTSRGSKLAISTAHYRFGAAALKWSWKTNAASFGTSNFKVLSKAASPLAYGDHFEASPTFILSVYSQNAQEGHIKITFKKASKEEVWFQLPLNFKGWRRFWVPFYEMEGNTPKKGAAIAYDYVEVSSSTKGGELFFDDIIFSQFQDDRHQYPDLWVPFIKKGQKAAKDHWMPLMVNLERIQQLKAKNLSATAKKDLVKIEQRLDQDLAQKGLKKDAIHNAKQAFKKLGLAYKKSAVVGPPLSFKIEQEYFDAVQQGSLRVNDIKDLGKALKNLAKIYPKASPAQQTEIWDMFLLGSRYFLDQGWQAGASGGTRHHIGYNVRELTEAFFMMRGSLAKAGLLNQIGASLQWLYNLGMVLGPEEYFHVNIDYLNTQAVYHLLLIFLVEEQDRQAALLGAYSNYISIILAQEKEEWGFKPDGTSWHHSGHYPAYGLGAFQKVPQLIHTLSGTMYRIAEPGHQNFKRALLTTAKYSHKMDWGFGNAGRHPFEHNTISSLQRSFLRLALSGNPQGTQSIDKEVAAHYIRLWGAHKALDSVDLEPGKSNLIPPYFTIPYGATAIHRHKDWAAIIKGYSKYVWASEIYVASNRYGRYPANGSVQLLNGAGEKASGFDQWGWDWNRFPGTTVINLPLQELEPHTPLLMYRSNETFAGAAALADYGVFAMVLNEGKGFNADGPEKDLGFPGRLTAKKSVFSFGDKLICIGTNISSVDLINPVQTNLFQTILPTRATPLFIGNKGALTQFPLSGSLQGNGWLIDPYGNGYQLLSKHTLHYQKQEQHSYHNKFALRSGAMNSKGKGVKATKGDFASAYIDHGVAPKNQSYQYVIYPFMGKDAQAHFGDKLAKTPSFKILQADHVAHIVADQKAAIMAYVIFDATTTLNHGLVQRVSDPALVMVKKSAENKLKLSVVQPDLNFPKHPKKKRGFINHSQPVTLTLTLNGIWNLKEGASVKHVSHVDQKTSITIVCRHGFSSFLTLQEAAKG